LGCASTGGGIGDRKPLDDFRTVAVDFSHEHEIGSAVSRWIRFRWRTARPEARRALRDPDMGWWRLLRVTLQGEVRRVERNVPRLLDPLGTVNVDRQALLLQVGAAF
jgi:hypothetical protein